MADVMNPTDPSTIDSPTYLFNKRKTAEQYNFGKAANDYSQAMEAQRAQRAQQNLGWQYKRAADNQAWTGANRGFDQNGATYQRSNEAMQQNKDNAYYSANKAHEQNMYNLKQSYETMTRNKDYTNQGLDLGEADRKAQLAASLRNIGSSSYGSGSGEGAANVTTMNAGPQAWQKVPGSTSGSTTSASFSIENMDQFPQLNPMDKYWIVYNQAGPDAAEQYRLEQGL